ncbi:unnamed protein product [Dicrocoelium dendriticum]|nr:unnamed protein product [Dicrocoelium dendriticum]
MGSGSSHPVTPRPATPDRQPHRRATHGSPTDGRRIAETQSPTPSWWSPWRANRQVRYSVDDALTASAVPPGDKVHPNETILFGQKSPESELRLELVNSLVKTCYPGSFRSFRQPYYTFGYHGVRITASSTRNFELDSNITRSSYNRPNICDSPIRKRQSSGEIISSGSLFDRDIEYNIYRSKHLQCPVAKSRMRYVKVVRGAVSVPDLSKVPIRSALKGGRNPRHASLTRGDNSVIPEMPCLEESPDCPTSLTFTLSTPQQLSPMASFSDPGNFGIDNLSPVTSDGIGSAPASHPDVCSMPFFFTAPKKSPGSPVLTSGNAEHRPSRNKCIVTVHDSEEQNVDSLLADAQEEEVEDIIHSPGQDEHSFLEPFQTNLAMNQLDSPFDDEGVSCDWTPRLHSIPLRRDSLGPLLDQEEDLLNPSREWKENLALPHPSKYRSNYESCAYPEETDDANPVSQSAEVPIIEALPPVLCAAGYGPVGQFLEKWLPHKIFREYLLRTDESTDVSSEVLWQRRKCLFYELAKTALIRQELNDYKLAEMSVHQDSRQYTRFHPT